MSYKKKHQEEHVDETWLIPYADMLTLLLALFIVMFAMSQVDKDKFSKMSTQLNIIFSGGKGLLEKEGMSVVPNSPAEEGKASDTVNDNIIEEGKMTDIKKRIEEEIKENGYSDKVRLDLNESGLEISIEDVILFNSGDAEVLKDVAPLLVQMSMILNDLDNNVTIVGHTDNVPINTDKFRSNWDLSAVRAINVMNFLVEKGGLQPDRFSIQGYGQYSPKYDNSTEVGRSKNRRVEIFIIRKYPANDYKTP